MYLYNVEKSVPLFGIAALILSKRIHSIFVLRMFNDGVATLFGYFALVLLTQRKYRTASIIHSIAISIKMNILLHSPGVLMVLLVGAGWLETVKCLSLCAIVQLLLGLPFLSTFPIEYLTKAFELGRVFMYKWTVNFKFLPESVFVSKEFSLALLLLTLTAYILFAIKWIKEVVFRCFNHIT